jgi:hypothetical protein
MKRLFFSAFIAGWAASPGQADEGFGEAELRSLAPFFEEAQCQTRCNTPDWVIERVTMPRDARTVAPDDRLYNVYTQPHGCGAGRCYEAFILRDSSSLTVIKHGLSVSPLRASEIPALASRSKLTRINRVSGASIVLPVSPARPSPKGLGVAIVDVEVTANARVRDNPTTNGSVILGVIPPGRFLSGQWVPADDGNGRWLRVDLGSLDEIQGQSSWPYGYIWDGNLRPVQPAPNGPGAAGSSSTLRSDLQARADRFYAAADLSSALEALADIVGVVTKMRDAGDLYIATQVFEIYDTPGSELVLADITRKNVWTLTQMVSTGLLKGWYARAKETGRTPPIRYEYAEVMVQNVLYAARAGSGDVPGAIADASGDQIDRIKEIAITYQQIRGQNETLVHNALNSALLDLDRYSRGQLDYKFVLQNIINSRKIATKLDSTTRRVMRDDTPTRLAIVADLQEVKLKMLRGDDVSVLLESMKAQYQGSVFAKDAAFLLGIPGWNESMGSSIDNDQIFPEDVAPAHRDVLRKYFIANPQFRLATTVDYPNWNEDKLSIWKIYDNRNPFYIMSDLNKDGRSDFAVVLIDTNARPNPQNGAIFNCTLAIFNQGPNQTYHLAHIESEIGSPQGSVLFLENATGSLSVGLWEGGTTPVRARRNGTYVFGG